MANLNVEESSFWLVAQHLQSAGQLCDIQLCVPSMDDSNFCSAINAHKVVLVASSLFFQSALQSGDLLDVYNFVGISLENLQLVVDYMYRRKTLDELLANSEAVFAAQSIHLLSRNAEVGCGSISDGADAVSDGDRTKIDAKTVADGGCNHKSDYCDDDADSNVRCTELHLETHMGNGTIREKGGSGDLHALCKQGSEIDANERSSRCMNNQESGEFDGRNCEDNSLADGIVKESVQISECDGSSQRQLDSPLNELNKKLSRTIVGGESDNNASSKAASPLVQEDNSCPISVKSDDNVDETSQVTDCHSASVSVLELIDDSSRFGSGSKGSGGDSLNKNLSSEKCPEQKCSKAKLPKAGQPLSSIHPNVNHVNYYCKSILKSNNCHPVPLSPKLPFAKAVIGGPREVLGRSTQRRRKVLNYKLLAEGIDMSDEDSSPCSYSAAPPLQNSGSKEGMKAVYGIDPDSSALGIKVKRKRGRPRKIPAADVLVVTASDEIGVVPCDELGNGRLSMDDVSGTETIKDDACAKLGQDVTVNSNKAEPPQQLHHGLTHDRIETAQFSPKRMRSTCVENSATACGNCTRTFKSPEALMQHRKVIHGVKHLYGCTLCGMELESMFLLKKHKKVVHQMTMYACNDCILQFKTREGLKIHEQKKHSGAKPGFKCQFCEKAFFLNGELKNHLLFHSEERNFLCDRCSRAFKSKSLLVRHTNTFHSNERNFQCDVCGIMFKTRNDCKAHRRRHFRIKNPIMADGSREKKRAEKDEYPCRDCGKVFKKRAHQLVHENLQHKQRSDGNAYMCTVCSKVFPIRHYLMQHIKNCHAQRRFMCQKCSQMFAQRGDLKKHEAIPGRCKGPVVEPKPFSCPHCQKGFSLKGNFSKHLQHPQRCRSHPANHDVIVVLSSNVTLTSTDAVGDIPESPTGEQLLVAPPGDGGGNDSIDSTSIVQLEEDGISVQGTYGLNVQNNVELQGLVNGKLVPISMSNVDGQYQFTINDLNSAPTGYQSADDAALVSSDNIEVHDDTILSDGIQGQIIMATGNSGHMVQEGESIQAVLMQDGDCSQVIVGDDISDQGIVGDDVSDQGIVGNDVSGRVIVDDDISGRVIVGNDISGRVILSDGGSGRVIVGDDVSGRVIVDDDVTGRVLVGDDVSGRVIIDDVSGRVIVGNDVSGRVIISDGASGRVIVGDDISSRVIVDDDVTDRVTADDDVAGQVTVGDDISTQVVGDDTSDHMTIGHDINSQGIIHDDVSGQVVLGDDVSGQVIHFFEEGMLASISTEEQAMEIQGAMQGHSKVSEINCHGQVEEVIEEIIHGSEHVAHGINSSLIHESHDSIYMTEVKQEVTDQAIEVTSQMVEVKEEVTE